MSKATRLERASHVVHGDRSELRLEDGRLTLVKEATTQASPTSVTVPVDRVRNATMERPSRGKRGWLHLGVVDGTPVPPTELAAASDPYTLPLTGRHVSAARKLERMIVDHVQRRGLPHEPRSSRPSSGVIVSVSTPEGGAGAAPPGDPEPATPPGDPEQAAPPGDPEPVAGPGDPEPTGPDAPPGPPPPPPPPSTEAPPDELADRLRQLSDLHEAGALSDQEFDRAKRQVLGG